MNCGRCNKPIEPDRIKVLPATRVCSACARVLNPPRVRGRMVYDCKTNPTIEVLDAETYKANEKYFNCPFGRGSAVHKFAKPTSSM